MNKQRYLAELQRLLVFMTEEDRERTLRRYAALLDGAGPEGEAALIEALGSPTKAAIGLSRGYEPGILPERLPGEPVPAPEEEPAPPASVSDGLWDELPDFDPEAPGLAEKEHSPAPSARRAPEAQAEPAAEPAVMPERPVRPPRESAPQPVVTYEKSMPLALGLVLFIIVFGALGLPLAALCLALAAALLAPGAAVLFGAYLAAVGGMWSMTYPADAILLFGLAFIVLAVGLVLLWGGLYLAVKLAGVYIRGLRWLTGELFGRKVTTYE